MSHEQSITVERGGRFYVLDNSGENAGAVLGLKTGFDTSTQADTYARLRSQSYNNPPSQQAQDKYLEWLKSQK
jgi:hypothetical protein